MRQCPALRLRDAEHLASGAGETSPAGRLHWLWRDFAGRPATLDAAAGALVELPCRAPNKVSVRRLVDELEDCLPPPTETPVAVMILWSG